MLHIQKLITISTFNQCTCLMRYFIFVILSLWKLCILHLLDISIWTSTFKMLASHMWQMAILDCICKWYLLILPRFLKFTLSSNYHLSLLWPFSKYGPSHPFGGLWCQNYSYRDTKVLFVLSCSQCSFMTLQCSFLKASWDMILQKTECRSRYKNPDIKKWIYKM